MTLAEINARINLLTDSSVAQYTYQQRLLSINKWYNVVHYTILQSQDEWDFDDSNKTDFAVLTTGLKANQADYSLPTGSLKVKRLETSYDGINWKKVEPFDVGESGSATDTTSVASNFSTDQPMYDIQGNSLVLYPAPTSDQAACLKIWIDRTVTEFTYTSEASNELLTGTKSPGFDLPFHDILALGAAYEWNSAKKKDKSLYQDIQIQLEALKGHYGRKQKDRENIFKPAYVNYN